MVRFVQAGVTFVPLIWRGSFMILGPLLLFRLFVPHLTGTQLLRLGARLAAGTGFHMVHMGTRAARALLGGGHHWLMVRERSGHLIFWEALAVLQLGF